MKNLTVEAIRERLEVVNNERCHYSLSGYERIRGFSRIVVTAHEDGFYGRRPSYNDLDAFEDGYNLICRDKLTGDLYEVKYDESSGGSPNGRGYVAYIESVIFRQIFRKDAEI